MKMIIKAEDAMFVWTPRKKSYHTKDYPLRGRVSVTTFPENPVTRLHPMSYGACNSGWKDRNRRWRMAQWMVTEMIHRDNIPVDEVRRAFMQTDEFSAFPFSLEAPEDDD
jgi:hypothetical protein